MMDQINNVCRGWAAMTARLDNINARVRHGAEMVEPLVAATNDTKEVDFTGNTYDAANRSVHNTIEHLVNGRVTESSVRKALGDALNQANSVPEPRIFPSRAMRVGGSAWRP